MKKMMVLGALILSAASVYAQESRQDASISATYLFAPQVNGNGSRLNTTSTLGALLSYRYMLTPRSALEANYGYGQDSEKFVTSNLPNGVVHARQQELSAAYVFNLNFRRFNPFVEAGAGALIFTPILDGSTFLDAKSNKSIGGLAGGGVAYEISPSFDVRAEYRAFIMKAPSFGLSTQNVNRYEVRSSPSIGIAYHF